MTELYASKCKSELEYYDSEFLSNIVRMWPYENKRDYLRGYIKGASLVKGGKPEIQEELKFLSNILFELYVIDSSRRIDAAYRRIMEAEEDEGREGEEEGSEPQYRASTCS